MLHLATGKTYRIYMCMQSFTMSSGSGNCSRPSFTLCPYSRSSDQKLSQMTASFPGRKDKAGEATVLMLEMEILVTD